MRRKSIVVAFALAVCVALAGVGSELSSTLAQIRAVAAPGAKPVQPESSPAPRTQRAAVPERERQLEPRPPRERVRAPAPPTAPETERGPKAEPEAVAQSTPVAVDVDGAIRAIIAADPAVAELIDDPDPDVRDALQKFIANVDRPAPTGR
ncbi:MAG TPA: hypothetical protein VMU03_02765 [Gammaproteobacteria bacterium]|nr:hypothetical protein [Gammaproteobacteria bacterium]